VRRRGPVTSPRILGREFPSEGGAFGAAHSREYEAARGLSSAFEEGKKGKFHLLHVTLGVFPPNSCSGASSFISPTLAREPIRRPERSPQQPACVLRAGYIGKVGPPVLPATCFCAQRGLPLLKSSRSSSRWMPLGAQGGFLAAGFNPAEIVEGKAGRLGPVDGRNMFRP